MTAADEPLRASILAVDDQPANLTTLEAVLEPLGQGILKAYSGEEALKFLLTKDVAVILMDVRMPGMDGIETARRIKQRERTREVPIIFLTAQSQGASNIFAGYSSGAVDFIQKPFDPQILRSKVSVFVELFMKTEVARRARERAKRPLNELRKNVGELEPERARKLVQLIDAVEAELGSL